MIWKYNIKTILTLLLVVASSGVLMAQGEPDHYLLTKAAKWVFVAVVLVILAFGASTLYKLTMLFIKVKEDQLRESMGLAPEHAPVKKESWWDKFYRQATDAVPIEHEADVLLDHNYDGIRELDNTLPPWWLWMFYITIIIGVLYFGYYHMSPFGMSSTEQYEFAMAKAADEVKAYKALQSDVVDENNLEALTDEASLALGQGIYMNNCAACHLANGAGSVGPNFTDNYWIHGGSISDIYKTIKYGVPEKGMISWQTQLRPNQMQQVASYILTLVGTNPPDGKAPQGDLYEPEAEGGGMK